MTNLPFSPILLTDPSPCLRWLVLRHLLSLPDDDPEVLELAEQRASDPLVQELLSLQDAGGSWSSLPSQYGKADAGQILFTAYALARLGYLGFTAGHPAVHKAAKYLFAQQQADGSWPLHYPAFQEEEFSQPESGREGYAIMPLQTVFPLRGLAACGYAADPRAEKAYDWLLSQRLPDGAWPTGIARSGVYGYVAGYRRLPHSRWGCRSNTTGALLCLSLHPQRRHSDEARRALDLLLGRQTRERHAMGSEVARLIGAEPLHGFITYFARFDLALILSLCARIGIAIDDERLASLVEFIAASRGPYGLWDYPERPQASRWVSFDLLHSLSTLDEHGEWFSLEPPTPFQPYPKKRKRF